MATLQELLLTPENAPRLIADTQALVDGEVSSKGITATPLKAAYKAVSSFAPGYLTEAITAMLPGMVHVRADQLVSSKMLSASMMRDRLRSRSVAVRSSRPIRNRESSCSRGRGVWLLP